MISLGLGVLLGVLLGRSPLGAGAETLIRSAFGAIAKRLAPAALVGAAPLLGVGAIASVLSPRVWRILLPIGAVIAILTSFGLWASGKGAARVEKRVAKETVKSEAKAVAIDDAVRGQQTETREKIVYRDRVIEKTVEVAKIEVRDAASDDARFASVRRALDGMCDGPCQTPAGNREADNAGFDGALVLQRPLAG